MANDSENTDRDIIAGEVDDTTRDAERKQADMGPNAGRMPTPEEEQAADAYAKDHPDAGKAEGEFVKMAAQDKGEGRIP